MSIARNHSYWRSAITAAAAVVCSVSASPAQAGLFDWLFGGTAPAPVTASYSSDGPGVLTFHINKTTGDDFILNDHKLEGIQPVTGTYGNYKNGITTNKLEHWSLRDRNNYGGDVDCRDNGLQLCLESRAVGGIPPGWYKVAYPDTSPTLTINGVQVTRMVLTPFDGTNTHGRGDLLIHPFEELNEKQKDGSFIHRVEVDSNGCVAMPLDEYLRIEAERKRGAFFVLHAVYDGYDNQPVLSATQMASIQAFAAHGSQPRVFASRQATPPQPVVLAANHPQAEKPAAAPAVKAADRQPEVPQAKQKPAATVVASRADAQNAPAAASAPAAAPTPPLVLANYQPPATFVAPPAVPQVMVALPPQPPAPPPAAPQAAAAPALPLAAPAMDPARLLTVRIFNVAELLALPVTYSRSIQPGVMSYTFTAPKTPMGIEADGTFYRVHWTLLPPQRPDEKTEYTNVLSSAQNSDDAQKLMEWGKRSLTSQVQAKLGSTWPQPRND